RSCSCLSPSVECFERELPLVRIDSNEMVLLSLFQERHPAPHLRIADDDARLRLIVTTGVIEGALHRIDVVAVYTLHVPAECLQLRDQRFERQDLRGRAIRL